MGKNETYVVASHALLAFACCFVLVMDARAWPVHGARYILMYVDVGLLIHAAFTVARKEYPLRRYARRADEAARYPSLEDIACAEERVRVAEERVRQVESRAREAKERLRRFEGIVHRMRSAVMGFDVDDDLKEAMMTTLWQTMDRHGEEAARRVLARYRGMAEMYVREKRQRWPAAYLQRFLDAWAQEDAQLEGQAVEAAERWCTLRDEAQRAGCAEALAFLEQDDVAGAQGALDRARLRRERERELGRLRDKFAGIPLMNRTPQMADALRAVEDALDATARRFRMRAHDAERAIDAALSAS